MGFIRDWFNDWAKESLLRQRVVAMLAAIQAQDIEAIKENWEKIEDKKNFMNAATDDGRGFIGSFLSEDGYARNTHVFSRLIVSAMDTGNSDVFKAVFELNPDPNYVVSYWASGDFADVNESYDPLLALAIKSGKKDIALYLVGQSDVRKDIVGLKWSKGFFRSDNSCEIDPVPLELARTTPGMKDVFHEMVKMNFPRSSAGTRVAQDLRPR